MESVELVKVLYRPNCEPLLHKALYYLVSQINLIQR